MKLEGSSKAQMLRRELGVGGAVMLGLGSIVGTGVFVSIGIAAGIAGPAVILATALAAGVAACNALSSAQLAANHPVAGGTYEYGYRYLRPWLGFSAGWLFLLAKSASAATAALGFAGYLLHALGETGDWARISVAVAAVLVLTLVVLAGMRQSNRVNITVVSLTLAALTAFLVAGAPAAVRGAREHFVPFFTSDTPSLLHACALMFVAYTGYGRIATLSEEVHDPRHTIPRAIIITLIVSMLLYVGVATVAVAAAGAPALGAVTDASAAPLEAVARSFNLPAVQWLVTAGAMTAMLGVLLNLILGLSRVLLAMGRRRDMPAALARLNTTATAPPAAVITVGGVIIALTLIGDVKTTWSFSAFTVLIYYALTNLAALHLPAEQRLFPAAISWIGLFSCTLLAFWIEWRVWATGLGLILAGLAWHVIARRRTASQTEPKP